MFHVSVLQVWSRRWQVSSPILWSWLKTASCLPPCWASECPGIINTSMIWRTAMDSSGSVAFTGQSTNKGYNLATSTWYDLFVMCVCVCSLSDLRAEEDCGVHLPHGLLCQHRHRPVGRSDHLQDQEELCLPTGHEVSTKTPAKAHRCPSVAFWSENTPSLSSAAETAAILNVILY